MTDEDRGRTEQYRDAAARARMRGTTGSHEEYLRELGIVVRICPPRPHELLRVSQLSLRTNQFNLTGERLPPERILIEGRRPLTVRVSDRYGDSGLVGALFTRRTADGLTIDNMLLSCRVLARGIEDGCLAAVLAHARDLGLPAVRARYRATRGNGRASGFYPHSASCPTLPATARRHSSGTI